MLALQFGLVTKVESSIIALGEVIKTEVSTLHPFESETTMVLIPFFKEIAVSDDSPFDQL